MGNKKELIWFKGNLVSKEDAKINILSPSVQYGINVFEGIRCYWNEKKKQLYAFKLDEHINRLLQSAKLIKFKHNYSFMYIKNAFLSTIRANNFREDIIVRITLFLDGFGSWSSREPIEMFISAIPKGRYFEKGIKCCVSSWQRIDDNSVSPRIKSGANYLNSRMAQLEAVYDGYDSAIFLNKIGKVAEAPGACIFIVRENQLITPTVTSSILESINRRFIVRIAEEELRFTVVERDVDKTELYIAEEVFLVGTAVEITPVIQIDEFIIGSGNIGNKTRKLQELFFAIVRGEYNINRYSKYLTPIYV